MTTTAIIGWDATHAGLPYVPKNEQGGGYATGLGDVPWTAADWKAFPGAVRIDQSPSLAAVDYTCDMFDYEAGAVQLGELPGLVKGAQAAWHAGTRPGQRWPGVYCSESNVTGVVSELTAQGVQCPLGVALYYPGAEYAREQVENSSGPYPIVWFQYSDLGGGGTYDLDYWSSAWLHNVSTIPPKPSDPPVVKDDNLMLHISVTAPAGHSWTGTRTFLYLVGQVPTHIIDQQSENGILKVLPLAPVTWQQYVAWGGV